MRLTGSASFCFRSSTTGPHGLFKGDYARMFIRADLQGRPPEYTKRLGRLSRGEACRRPRRCRRHRGRRPRFYARSRTLHNEGATQ